MIQRRQLSRTLAIVLLATLPSVAAAAPPAPTAVATLRLHFGPGTAAGPELRLGVVSRQALSGGDHFTGMGWSRTAGWAPVVLGLRPGRNAHRAANEDDTGLPWRWIAAAAVGVVALAAVSGSDTRSEDERQTNADRECELASTDGNNTNIVSGDCP